jgi:hypothetical protein
MKSVYCAVQTGSLNQAACASSLRVNVTVGQQSADTNSRYGIASNPVTTTDDLFNFLFGFYF